MNKWFQQSEYKNSEFINSIFRIVNKQANMSTVLTQHKSSLNHPLNWYVRHIENWCNIQKTSGKKLAWNQMQNVPKCQLINNRISSDNTFLHQNFHPILIHCNEMCLILYKKNKFRCVWIPFKVNLKFNVLNWTWTKEYHLRFCVYFCQLLWLCPNESHW